MTFIGKSPDADQSIRAEFDISFTQDETYIGTGDYASLPPALVAQMSRLHSLGYYLVPCGKEDGKSPLVNLKTKSGKPAYRLRLDLVLRKMSEAGSQTYGILLPNLLVVDVDSDTPEARAFIAEHIGHSPFETRTSRGYHLYFKHRGPKPKNINTDKVQIDFKHGARAFVIGPTSTRPDGKSYIPEGMLGPIQALPEFGWIKKPVDPEPVSKRPDAPKAEGASPGRSDRNDKLFKYCMQVANNHETEEELRHTALAYRIANFADLATFSEEEALSVASSAWEYRASGRIYTGRNSVFQVNREILDMLLRSYGSDTWALYSVLHSEHGHTPGKEFTVVGTSEIFQTRLSMSRNKIYAACRNLEAEQLLVYLRKLGPKEPKLYRLNAHPRIGGDSGRGV